MSGSTLAIKAPAKCKNATCPCNSFDGRYAHYCSIECRDFRPCQYEKHVFSVSKQKLLTDGKDIPFDRNALLQPPQNQQQQNQPQQNQPISSPVVGGGGGGGTQHVGAGVHGGLHPGSGSGSGDMTGGGSGSGGGGQHVGGPQGGLHTAASGGLSITGGGVTGGVTTGGQGPQSFGGFNNNNNNNQQPQQNQQPQHAHTAPLQQPCVRCKSRLANNGKDLCQVCYDEYMGRGSSNPTSPQQGGGGSGGVMSPQLMQLRQQAASRIRQMNYGAPLQCQNCRGYQKNPGIEGVPICSQCSVNIVRANQQWIGHLRENNIKFYEKNEPYYEFANFFPVEVEHQGKLYPTTEHLFQAWKFLDTAPEVAELIRNSPSPRSAFTLSHDYYQLERADWAKIKDEVMMIALRKKFIKPHLYQIIMSTVGVEMITEHTKNDSYWADGGDGSGRNQLGKSLLIIRDELQSGKLKVPEHVVAMGVPRPPPAPGSLLGGGGGGGSPNNFGPQGGNNFGGGGGGGGRFDNNQGGGGGLQGGFNTMNQFRN